MPSSNTRDPPKLSHILREAGLDASPTVTQPLGGSTNRTWRIALSDGRTVILREYLGANASEKRCTAAYLSSLLTRYAVPVPTVLASTEQGSQQVELSGDIVGLPLALALRETLPDDLPQL